MDVIERRDKDYSGIRPQLPRVGKQVKTGFGRREIDENHVGEKDGPIASGPGRRFHTPSN